MFERGRILASFLLLCPVVVLAQDGEFDETHFDEGQDEESQDEESQDEESQDEELEHNDEEGARGNAHGSEQAFDQIMRMNAAPPAAQAAVGNVFGNLGGAPNQNLPGAFEVPASESTSVPRKAIIPLQEYERVTREVERRRADLARSAGPSVVLGAASYAGELVGGTLRLDVALDVTLGAGSGFKFVPLVGEGAVLVRALAGGQPISVIRRDGYHVWVTQQSGEVRLALEVAVPARGPRGSIEFDFSVPRTPVTRVECVFPGTGLEPRVDAAVSSEVSSRGSATVVIATLRPTTRIHLVGFKDLGTDSEGAAKIYAQSSNLLSVDDGAFELFSVIRYTILYGAAKEFVVSIPAGVDVVSADGEGAFRHDVEKRDDGSSILRGETAFPIRGAYEISLRLRRESTRSGMLRASLGEFVAPIPRAVGVEREQGYLGIEVPGKLRLEQKSIKDILPIDVRQLPPEMVESAVSPILKAYRYHSEHAEVRLIAERLPEKDPASASIDRVKAVSVLAPEGRVLTQLQITLRNRIRPSLALDLQGSEVRSTLLGDEPVKPSRDEEGRLVVPLKRSAGGDTMEPFTVEIVLESHVGAFRVFGKKELQLPSLDLPISSLEWSVFVPARNSYSRLTTDTGAQRLAGEASWHQAPFVPHDTDASPSGALTRSADTGSMPVRFEIPESGVRLEQRRYWIEAGRRVPVTFSYIRSWVVFPAQLGFAAILFALLSLAFRSPQVSSRAARAGLAIVAGLFAAKAGALVAFAAVALLDAARRWRWVPRSSEALNVWWTSLPTRFAERERVPSRTWGLRALRLGLFAMTAAMLLGLVAEVGALLWIFGNS